MGVALHPDVANLLLAQSGAALRSLAPHLTVVTLRRGQTLTRRHDPIAQLVFPHHAVVSLVTRTAEGQAMETGLIGREGCVGTEALLGADGAVSDSTVQVPGDATIAALAPMQAAFAEDAGLHDALLRHLRALLAQVMQSVACNRMHAAPERCGRWLLMVHDRAGRDDLALTQEFLAEMLGVRRPTVTLVLQALQQAGLIATPRGRIVVRDRAGLERAACECHRVIRRALDDVGLGLPVP